MRKREKYWEKRGGREIKEKCRNTWQKLKKRRKFYDIWKNWRMHRGVPMDNKLKDNGRKRETERKSWEKKRERFFLEKWRYTGQKG